MGDLVDMQTLMIVQQGVIVFLHAMIVHAFATHWEFENELVFYGSYHADPYNQLIHFFCVPMIWWCLVTLFCYVPLFNTPVTLLGHKITWGSSVLFFYCGYYLTLDPNFGSKIFVGLL